MKQSSTAGRPLALGLSVPAWHPSHPSRPIGSPERHRGWSQSTEPGVSSAPPDAPPDARRGPKQDKAEMGFGAHSRNSGGGAPGPGAEGCGHAGPWHPLAAARARPLARCFLPSLRLPGSQERSGVIGGSPRASRAGDHRGLSSGRVGVRPGPVEGTTTGSPRSRPAAFQAREGDWRPGGDS